jgi:excisionase family DNA binding protein
MDWLTLDSSGTRLPVTPNEQALTVKEVALLLQVDEKTIYRLTQKGDLPGFKVASSWRFKRADMDAWVERQKTAARASLKSAAPGKKKERH